jgi:tetratricopeptide (TPR) repeat protein
MAGWMAHEAGRDAAAEEHFQRAERLAVAAGDTELAAHVMVAFSYVAHQQDRSTDAVSYANRGGAYLAAGRPNRDVEARLYAMAARGYAAVGDERACKVQLNSAEQALDREPGPGTSPWTSQFDHAAFTMEAARCFQALGRLDSARRSAETVLSLRHADRPRSRSYAQLLLASVLIAERRVDEACAMARKALDTTAGINSAPLIRQLDRVGRRLDGQRRTHDVGEFLDLLQHELAARHHQERPAST